MVTSGGYGSDHQALSVGIPLVGAGRTEDKAEVNARIAWSGAGVDLATNTPTPEATRTLAGDCLVSEARVAAVQPVRGARTVRRLFALRLETGRTGALPIEAE